MESLLIPSVFIRRDVEKAGNSLTTPSMVTLGNSSMLNVDPVLDKTTLFSRLYEAYKLDSKVCAWESFWPTWFYSFKAMTLIGITPSGRQSIQKAEQNTRDAMLKQSFLP